jgi:cold shock CspA family protein
MNHMMGQVTYYNREKVFGFIRELGGSKLECFFHLNQVADKTILQGNDIVVFQLHTRPYKPGRLEATAIRLVKRDPAPTEVVEAKS